jgi:hypothetical protein
MTQMTQIKPKTADLPSEMFRLVWLASQMLNLCIPILSICEICG